MRTESGPADGWPYRDPLPTELPLSDHTRFSVGRADGGRWGDRADPWRSQNAMNQIPKFYSEAIYALERYDKNAEPADGTPEWLEQNFAASLIAPREGSASTNEEGEWLRRKAKRIDRYLHRRHQAHVLLSREPVEGNTHGGSLADRFERITRTFRGHSAKATLDAPDVLDVEYEHDATFLRRIATENLTSGGASLPFFVIMVQAEAHLSMHGVEAWQAMCLGEHADVLGERERKWLRIELERCIALSTFAYCVSRTAPWIFAEDDAERDGIFRSVSSAWENVVPARCMWIAGQVSLLALHRRAYAHAMCGRPDLAYNDYHKLQRLIRDTERRVRAAPIHVEGALEFLAGLDAEAHHHIGELYRGEHAYKPALEHFEAASHRLELLHDGPHMDAVITNSRWRVQLHISRGKAFYEMGKQKEALYWYLHAWRAFLELLADETGTEANSDKIDKAISWLERIKFEPELRKSEVSLRLRPLVDQLERITIIPSLRVLAAEVLLRLGHLLFVLNVGFDGSLSAVRTVLERDQERAGALNGSTDRAGEGGVPRRGEKAREGERERSLPTTQSHERATEEHVGHTLAYACLIKAAECDPHSTLVAADLLTARFRFNDWLGGPLTAAYRKYLRTPRFAPVAEHWPRGSDDYERLARVAEYLMLRGRIPRFEESSDDETNESATNALVARDLLLSLFMNTDSINVRKAQIHRFLMKGATPGSVPGERGAPTIELICMRRYSSPFPLLPRPSAFRSLGGGYFVRLYSDEITDPEVESSARPSGALSVAPYGIVIDPGVDFVENLYRAGYSLSDIDMIIVTHDHVDHLGALDPLLSLLHVRSELLSKQVLPGKQAPPPRPIKLVVSKSVDARYRGVMRVRDSAEFQFACFEDGGIKDDQGRLDPDHSVFDDFPSDFEVVMMSSAAGTGANGGHRDLSGLPSHGVCFRTREEGPSVAITSDIPRPPTAEGRNEWRRIWMPALSADVLVVHLGSVPLTELRRLDPISHLMNGRASGEAESVSSIDEDEVAVKRIREDLQQAEKSLQGQIEYAQWLRSHVEVGAEPLTADLIGLVQEAWLPPPDHAYLEGLLAWAREYSEARGEAPGLFVIGELSEELGSMRGKVASRLNDRLFCVDENRQSSEAGATMGFSYALTADIGLHLCASPPTGNTGQQGPCVKALCTTCNLDSDRVPDECYHIAHDVFEVCVKGENEGIFYNCREHDPARQDDPTFLEQLERFDIFGR